jgi:hypothetical protein
VSGFNSAARTGDPNENIPARKTAIVLRAIVLLFLAIRSLSQAVSVFAAGEFDAQKRHNGAASSGG